MRVTPSILSRSALGNVQRQQLRLAETQLQASSGLRINRPSDDPVGVRAATLLKAGIDATTQFQRNISQVRPRVAATEASLSDATEVLSEARRITIQGINDTLDAETRALLAADVEALHDRLLADANREGGGSYVFSGFAGGVRPFDRAAFVDGAPSPPVTFAGDANQIETEIEGGVRVETGLDGRRVFLGDSDGDGSPDAGREDLFAVLGDLRDALRTDDPAAARPILDRLDAGLDQLNRERSRIGAVDSRLDSFSDRHELRQLDLAEQLSDTQDADAIAVFSDLVIQETALRASLEASARLLQPSLMDFLG